MGQARRQHLTLLHTPKTRGGYSYQDRQDFGHHTFTYSVVGHAGDYRDAATVAKAEVLNQPLMAFVAADKHKGALGRSFSFVRSENDNVALRALKQAEKSDEYVVRFYETAGEQAQQAVVDFAADIVSAKELNGVEDEIGDVAVEGGKLKFEIGPFAMKTFKVKLAAPLQHQDRIVQPLSFGRQLRRQGSLFRGRAAARDDRFQGYPFRSGLSRGRERREVPSRYDRAARRQL